MTGQQGVLQRSFRHITVILIKFQGDFLLPHAQSYDKRAVKLHAACRQDLCEFIPRSADVSRSVPFAATMRVTSQS